MPSPSVAIVSMLCFLGSPPLSTEVMSGTISRASSPVSAALASLSVFDWLRTFGERNRGLSIAGNRYIHLFINLDPPLVAAEIVMLRDQT